MNNNSENGITQGEECPVCGTTFIYANTGKCVSCSKRKPGLSTNMKLVNRRRKLQKEREENNFNNDSFYFEDK